jgi:hypothetical protein
MAGNAKGMQRKLGRCRVTCHSPKARKTMIVALARPEGVAMRPA